jgi:hypothetical protein
VRVGKCAILQYFCVKGRVTEGWEKACPLIRNDGVGGSNPSCGTKQAIELTYIFCYLGVAPGAVRILLRWKVGLKDRLQRKHRCRHADPIAQGRDAQWPEFAVGLRYVHSSDRIRSIPLLPIDGESEFYRGRAGDALWFSAAEVDHLKSGRRAANALVECIAFYYAVSNARSWSNSHGARAALWVRDADVSAPIHHQFKRLLDGGRGRACLELAPG